ncbi:MAG: signal recognition particle-docking protein FtsY [Candidatus Pacearchaeota archaeon]
MFKFFREKIKNFLGKSEKKPIEESKKDKENKIIKEKKKEKKREEKKEKIEHIIEEIKEVGLEESKEDDDLTEKKDGFFSKLKKKISTITLSKEHFEEIFEELEMILLESNVSVEVVDKIKKNMEKRLVDIEVKKEEIESVVKDTLIETIREILIEPFDLIEKIKSKKDEPFVILFFGINGAGKTTTIAKIVYLLQKYKISSVMAAADTFRAASIEQLEKHGERLGVKVIKHDYGSDPAAVGFDAIKYAKSHGIKAVLIDTAGRMHTKNNLIKEMEKIIRITKPDLKIFVAEAITGNDATEQAKIFNKALGVDASILSKADVDERGGTSISIGYITGKPIIYFGVGQNYEDLQKFNKDEILVNLGLI